MAKIDIPLMMTDRQPISRQQLKVLFSYPNIPDTDDTLDDTILHWFGQTLERDGYKKEMASVSHDDGTCIVHLDGPPEDANQRYATRLNGLLQIGWDAWNRVQLAVMRDGRWDPANTNEWRFFLTLGVGIANFKSLQMFHYPPARLLDPLRDSMHDPVTARCRDLLEVNGVRHDPDDNVKNETRLYETRINSTPIAAPDDQGTPRPPYRNGVFPDPVSGSYIPIEYFTEFQQKMIQLYLHPHPEHEGYTIPMIVYGRTPRQQLAGMWMGPDCAAVLQMLPARQHGRGAVDGDNYLKTPVLGSNHPYLFYALAQISSKRNWNVGCGRLVPENVAKCISVMQDDLAVTYWQVNMADNPSQDPWAVIKQGREFWKRPEQQLNVCSLIWRQASLYYKPDDPLGNHFLFNIDNWKTAKQTIDADGYGDNPEQFLKDKSAAVASESTT